MTSGDKRVNGNENQNEQWVNDGPRDIARFLFFAANFRKTMKTFWLWTFFGCWRMKAKKKKTSRYAFVSRLKVGGRPIMTTKYNWFCSSICAQNQISRSTASILTGLRMRYLAAPPSMMMTMMLMMTTMSVNVKYKVVESQVMFESRNYEDMVSTQEVRNYSCNRDVLCLRKERHRLADQDVGNRSKILDNFCRRCNHIHWYRVWHQSKRWSFLSRSSAYRLPSYTNQESSRSMAMSKLTVGD